LPSNLLQSICTQFHKTLASPLKFAIVFAKFERKKEFQRCHGEELKENRNDTLQGKYELEKNQ
jgi:ribosome-interacting GTPase 1